MLKSVLLSVIGLIIISANAYSQKVGFVNSNTLREKFPEAQQAQQRVQSMTEEWKRELDAMQQRIDNLEFEIKKNRLVWTETEKQNKESELLTLRKTREEYAKSIFEPNGKYDQAVATIFTPVEEKIYASVQQVAADQGFDILVDQSVQPLPYVNYKYDMTVKVLKNLGVKVDELEKDLQDRIDKDPRNQAKETKQPRRRGRTSSTDDENQLNKKPDNNPDPNSTIKPDNDPEKIKQLQERRINR